MNVEAVMKPHIATIRPNDLLSTAAQMMLWVEGRHLPVVEDGQLLGVLTERDMLRAHAEKGEKSIQVREVMSTPAHTIAPDDSIATAAARMATEKLGCLPVMRGSKLVGLVTATDVLAAFEREHFSGDGGAMDVEVKRELESLRTVRDRLRVQAHLGGMELREVWRDLEGDFAEAERRAVGVGKQAMDFIRGLRERAEEAQGKVIQSLLRELNAANRRARTRRAKHETRSRATDAHK